MINVTCGIILKDSRVLITLRSEKMQLALKWEFLGGKMIGFDTEIEAREFEFYLKAVKNKSFVEILPLSTLC